MKEIDDTNLDENTKTAIAVLFTNVINADGMVYESELSGLQEIKYKYSLAAVHFRNVNTMSLATAINKIIDTAKKKEYNLNLYSMIYDDLIKVAGVNGNVSPEEAMICLAFRYAYDFQEAHFFDYEYKSIKLAKWEVIYIDDGQNEHIGELHEENRRTIYRSSCNSGSYCGRGNGVGGKLRDGCTGPRHL